MTFKNMNKIYCQNRVLFRVDYYSARLSKLIKLKSIVSISCFKIGQALTITGYGYFLHNKTKIHKNKKDVEVYLFVQWYYFTKLLDRSHIIFYKMVQIVLEDLLEGGVNKLNLILYCKL